MTQKEILAYYANQGGLQCKEWSVQEIYDKVKQDLGEQQVVFIFTCWQLKSVQNSIKNNANGRVMRYFNYDMMRDLPESMRATLERYFSNRFGVGLITTSPNGEVELVSVDTCVDDGRYTMWTHYANLQRCEKGWELNSQFHGENHDQMWIYGYFKNFGSAVRNLATKGIKDRKPIKIYL